MAMERWRPFGSVERWPSFRSLSDIQSEMNRMFDSVFGHPAAVGTGERLWAPVCDMWESKDEIVVSFEVPGISEKDVNVSITGDVLSVRGERRWENGQKEDSYHRIERAYGKFERAVELPMPVQADKVKATYRDGVLAVHLPKAEEVKPREIKINIL